MSYDIEKLKQMMGEPNSRGHHKTSNAERDKVMTDLHALGYSYNQIGELFGITQTSVFYAIKRLREGPGSHR